MKYWDYIVENLPDYSMNEYVLAIDILTRWLEGQEVSESDLDFAFNTSAKPKHTVENAIRVMQTLERLLMIRAMEKEQDSFVRSILDVKGGAA